MSIEVLYHRCAGIDVHQRVFVVSLSIIEAGKRRREVRTFRHETADLLALRAWLLQEQCSHVAMESTGVYWMRNGLPAYSNTDSSTPASYPTKNNKTCGI